MKTCATIVLLLALSLFARDVTFEYTPNVQPERVNLAGSFNGWSADATSMSDVDGDGTWAVTLALPDGEYQYKFVVNGGQWLTDPNNPKGAPDGYGGQNSVITVGDWKEFIGQSTRGDGEILYGAVWHEQALPYYCDDGKGNLWFRIRVKKDDIDGVYLKYKDYRTGRSEVPMAYIASEYPFEWFEISLPSIRKLDYSFRLVDGDVSREYPAEGELSYKPGAAPVFMTPEWVRGAMFYQIFPERFADGDPSNNPENSVAWGSKPEYDNFMGGDLRGVIDHLDYIDEIGVDVIYFNPIFEASSNHKYDTHDYAEIDDNFGDDGLFDELDAATESLGIKIVLDGVFNHIGYGSPIFQDVIKKGKSSKYADWFFIHSFPVTGPDNPNYDCWWGFGSLPKLNTDNTDVRKYLFRAIRKWMEHGADGWRLDVANEVPHEFWSDFRDTIRSIDPQAYSIGEIWGDGTPWFNGEEFDAVMNYRFRDACIEFFAKSNITPGDFMDRLGGYIADYPQPVNGVLMNLLGSHDTPRFQTIAGDEKWRLKLTYLWALTWPGVPCIYYGDEIGMTGGKDPDCRKAFPWENDKWDKELFEYVRYLGNLRDKNPGLKFGTARPLYIDNKKGVLVIERRYNNDLTVIAVNTSDESQEVSVELLEANDYAPADFRPFHGNKLGMATEAFSGKRYYDPEPLEFTIQAQDGMLFIIK